MREYRALVYDIDGVLSDFNSAYGKLLKAGFPSLNLADIPKTKSWQWPKELGVPKEVEDIAWETIKENPDFWPGLKPLASKAEMEDIGNYSGVLPTYVITSRPDGYGYSIVDATIRWLEKYNLDTVGVIVAEDKAALVKPLGIRFFIDDKPENVNEVAKVVFENCQKTPIVALMPAHHNGKSKLVEGVQIVESVMEFNNLVYEVIKADLGDKEDENNSVSGTEGHDIGGEG